MNVQDKILRMESVRGKNHPLSMFREWLDTYLPEHKNIKKIQIGGTNGKGSTCQWMNLLLQKEGYAVGMFTSPHLICHTERIRINGVSIPLADWERIYDRFEPLFDSMHMTMFEMDLWMALAYFIEKKTDYALMEVGMGGRLDATTSLDYIASIITNVGKDHTEFLGDTLEEIASEKAGIFKEGVCSITSEDVCFSVLEREAEKKGVHLFKASYDISGFDTSMLAAYQMSNLSLALSTLDRLNLLDEKIIQDVIYSFGWAGRFMKVKENPDVIVDGAHNVPGIQALVRSAQGFKGHIYFSVLKEKDAQTMIEILKSLNCEITLVSFDSYRLYDLADLEKQFGLEIIDFDLMMDRIRCSEENCLVCGSLYFVGDVLKNINN